MLQDSQEKISRKRVTREAKVIGANLKNMRLGAGLSLQQIAAVLDITHQQVQKYETGQNRFPVEKLYRLRRFYGVPYEIFFDGLAPLEQEEGREWRLFIRLMALPDRELKKKIEEALAALLA